LGTVHGTETALGAANSTAWEAARSEGSRNTLVVGMRSWLFEAFRQLLREPQGAP